MPPKTLVVLDINAKLIKIYSVFKFLQMLPPVRCFTCNKPTGHLWKKYAQMMADGKEPVKIFETLGVSRYCCRRMLMSHVNVIDTLLQYPSAPGQKAVFRKDEQ